MSYKAVYALVHDKWGAKLKVARKSHQKKNELASETFVSDFDAQVEATISEKRSDFKSVRLFCQDESRFGLLPVAQRRITLPGVKPVAKVNPMYKSVYLYGAVAPLTGEGCFLELSHLTADCFQLFIDHLSSTFSEDLNVMVLDNGRFHHSQELEMPENVVLLFLPPYCPELNPIERLWQDLKAKLFTRPYGTLAEMQARLTEVLCNYSDKAIAKLTRFSYFLKTANEI